ncbi:DUF6077 domain-containing protein [Acerihabitans arboris]|uniref:Uncharacterized protein n=1 Tax=Acerihabitans arboris TaxID=2691583 RepID=A0A845SSR2_9GAMM|nr:DUF6077 domain-containing protein [Acerihabitans arboris]NDL64125.1 hypothetical protein [Acerihabitans arboris]
MIFFKKWYSHKNERLELTVSFIVSAACILFSLWTISVQMSSFLHIPWMILCKTFTLSLTVFIPLSVVCAVKFSSHYLDFLKTTSQNITIPNFRIISIIIFASIMTLALEDYKIKFSLIMLSFLSIIIIKSNTKQDIGQTRAIPTAQVAYKHGYLLFILLVFISVIINMVTYRSDFDDSHFIQLASQTLLHPELAPLTFDTTLGFVYDHFRFAPYRIASYEMLIALISYYSKINLFDVYYLVVPAITSALTLGVAFLFSRVFLNTNKALLATALFLIIMLAWGDVHVAYGNRVFVRLFQGKGLLIALTTPITIIAGLMLIKKPGLANILPLLIAQIVTIGVSSSGLVLTVFTSALIMFCAINNNIISTIKRCAYIGLSLIYPAFFVLWLKLFNPSIVSLEQVGTYLPVNSSLGLSFRASLTLIILLIGFALTYQRLKVSSYPILVFTTILFILNPWFADLVADFSSRNMSWRLGWAAPVPLLISIGLAMAITHFPKPPFVDHKPAFAISTVGLILFIMFLCGGRWAISPTNNVVWGKPSIKVSPEYYTTIKIVNEITKAKLAGTILSASPIAAWIPLIKPNTGIVMPGHTYPVMLQTTMPAGEFSNRMRLYDAINSQVPNLTSLVDEMKKYHVGILIINAATRPGDILKSSAPGSNEISIIFISTINEYSIYQVKYEKR